MRRWNERDQNFRRGVLAACALICIALVAHGIFGADGLLTLLEKQHQQQSLSRQIQQMKQENQNLQKEVQGLKSDPATIERYAREELHMARQGEIIYVLPQREKNSANVSLNQQGKKPR
ncbi:MAG TPA: septum formation initiator family protein [Terriglobia bacterium]|nr:septum formation initiator family protein [Terriglobia bacterium]